MLKGFLYRSNNNLVASARKLQFIDVSGYQANRHTDRRKRTRGQRVYGFLHDRKHNYSIFFDQPQIRKMNAVVIRISSNLEGKAEAFRETKSQEFEKSKNISTGSYEK